ncbi:DUF6881 domain-containing protein [Mechercharimyces sp. CAU 1602]|uniref:DUF6881 domain-containing protein n=1 Tax=Mechercharimyces sp. CAU 1602 TaxID=2973933 RepID=UPI0037CAEABC
MKVIWIHELQDEPTEYYLEVDQKGFEIRKIVMYRDGKVEFATETIEYGAFLSPVPVGTVEEISEEKEFEATEISKQEFLNIWESKVEPLS